MPLLTSFLHWSVAPLKPQLGIAITSEVHWNKMVGKSHFIQNGGLYKGSITIATTADRAQMYVLSKAGAQWRNTFTIMPEFDPRWCPL